MCAEPGTALTGAACGRPGGAEVSAAHMSVMIIVSPASRPVVLAPGDSDTFPELTGGPIRDLAISRDVNGTYSVHPSLDLNLKDVLTPEFLHTGAAGADAFIERHWLLITDFLAERYDADVTAGDDDILRIEFSADLGDAPLTEERAADTAWNNTRITALANEADHGTFGSENLGRLITDRVAASVVVADRGSARAAAEQMTDATIDAEVQLKLGQNEIQDATAMAIARTLTGQFGRAAYPALHRLSYAGYADADQLNRELRALYEEHSYGRTGRRIDMMFTWVLHGAGIEAAA